MKPGRISSLLWTFGSSLLHSGVVINDKEYAYGGHDHQGLSGVYWTQPRTEPPGASFRTELLHGFAMRTDEEITSIIVQVSEDYLGPSYNLLSKNCNHFTNALCQKMTGQPAPAWLNRAAGIGIALPCVVPREWIDAPDHETADGELLDVDEDEGDERARMLQPGDERQQIPTADVHSKDNDSDDDDCVDDRTYGPGHKSSSHYPTDRRDVPTEDTSGRLIPASERAPVHA
ncbi:MAG: hypothetical protein M1817_001719 [Caeruleum heppii]|nr:MAG: hypothetical protein M1817_001719 [Caeruleum heppii]